MLIARLRSYEPYPAHHVDARLAPASAGDGLVGDHGLVPVTIMKACLNGARRPGEHPRLPLSPDQVGVAAAAAVAAGAEALHVHPRDRGGVESLAAEDVGATVAAVRSATANVPVGVSTGLWISGGDHEARRRAVATWAELPPRARPDFASVNVGGPGFGDLVRVLLDADIAVEAGVWTPAEAEALGARDVLRVLVEIVTGPAATATARADEILDRLDRAGSSSPRLLHGEEDACWRLIEHAGRLGLPTRIGLEDTLVDDAGRSATDNAALVTRALELWHRASRDRPTE